MRILNLADVHLFDYRTHTQINQAGVPDRLTQYQSLAEDCLHVARQHGADCFVIEGDLTQFAVNRPMVLDAAQEFLSTLVSSSLPVLVYDGNHDLDSRGDALHVHSVLAPICRGVPGVMYVSQESLVPLCGGTAYVRPFLPGARNYAPPLFSTDNADVFFGHGAVATSTDPFGYVYRKGYSPDELMDLFKVSVVGDIHHYQVFNRGSGQDKRTVVIPGQPLQQNFNSGFPCGVSITDTETVDTTFISARDLPQAKSYHYFRARCAQQDELAEFPNTHYQERKTKQKTTEKSVAVAAKGDDGTQLWGLMEEAVGGLNLQYKDDVVATLREAYEQSQSARSNGSLRELQLMSVTAENFLSIKAPYTWEPPDEDCAVLLRGERNGVGKTTLMEAVFWAVTGELTKRVLVANITNDTSDAPAVVSVVLRGTDGTVYKVVRSRDTKALLKFFVNGADVTGDSVPTTQRAIYSTLGCGKDELLSLSYFSLKGASVFSGLSSAEQLDFVSKFSRVDRLDAVREFVKGKIAKLIEERDAATAELAYLEKRAIQLQGTLDEPSAFVPVVVPSFTANELSELTRKAELEHTQAVAALAEVEGRKKKVDEVQSRVTLVASKLKAERAQLQTLLQEKGSVESQLRSVRSGTCYACGSPVHDTELEKRLDMTMQSVESRLSICTTRAKQLATSMPEVDERAVLAVEADMDVARDAVQKADTKRSEAFVAARTAVATANREKEQATHTARVAAAREELDSVKGKISAVPAGALRDKCAEYAKVLKTLDRGGKNQVYLRLIDRAHQDFISKVNGALSAFGAEVKVGTNKELSVRTNSVKYRPVGSLSGGEERIFDFAVMIALGGMYCDYHGVSRPPLGIQMYDEVFVYLADHYFQSAYELLSEAPGVKLVASNDAGLVPLFSRQIFVTNGPDGSKYEDRNWTP